MLNSTFTTYSSLPILQFGIGDQEPVEKIKPYKAFLKSWRTNKLPQELRDREVKVCIGSDNADLIIKQHSSRISHAIRLVLDDKYYFLIRPES